LPITAHFRVTVTVFAANHVVFMQLSPDPICGAFLQAGLHETAF
jgi:hypothetical protein